MTNAAYHYLLSLAARRSGCCTRIELLANGLTESAITRLRARGTLQVIRPGIYVVPWLVDDRTPYVTALAGFDRGAVSHTSAARVHRLPVGTQDGLNVEITVPFASGGRRFRGVTVHRTRLPLDVDVVELEGLPVTSLARTLFDLAPAWGRRRLRHVLQFAMIHRGLTEQQLWSCYQARAQHRVRGVASMRTLMAELFGSGLPPQSMLEQEFALLLAQAGLSGFRRQYRPPWFDGVRGAVDFADPEVCVIVEVDGRPWHATTQSMAEDRRRDRIAAVHGWLVIRVLSEEIVERQASVVDEIQAAVARRSSDRAA